MSTTTTTTSNAAAAAAHSETTLQLAKNEHAEHMEGMEEAIEEMKQQSLIVKAYALDDDDAPTVTSDDNNNDKKKKNVKTVHFVRHGQGFHNLMADRAAQAGQIWVNNTKTPENPYYMQEILDAPLTEKGRQQALALQSTVRTMKHVPQLIVFSPLCRALQTGLLVFEELLKDKGDNNNKSSSIPLFVAHEMVREEFGIHVCDQRRSKIRQEYEFPYIDFSLLQTNDDVMFLHDRRETKVEVARRIYTFLEWLEQRPEQHIGVASHSAWLLTAFNANFQCCGNNNERLKDWFQTGEMRSVVLEFIRKD